MRLFNQTKNLLSWSMGGAAYSCEPWGPVDVPEELLVPVKSRGLPLDLAPVAVERRAQQRIADETEARSNDVLRSLRDEADTANAAAKAAKDELERRSVELSDARQTLREARETELQLRGEIARLKADKEAAEQLLTQEAAKATESEARAIRAEALLREAQKPAKQKRDQATA